jgi:hypothetical protein
VESIRTPVASVNIAAQLVVLRIDSSLGNSSVHAWRRYRFFSSASCVRLAVTGSNVACARGSPWSRRHRAQDSKTASPTTPVGDCPSSKNRWRASSMRAGRD